MNFVYILVFLSNIGNFYFTQLFRRPLIILKVCGLPTCPKKRAPKARPLKNPKETACVEKEVTLKAKQKQKERIDRLISMI